MNASDATLPSVLSQKLERPPTAHSSSTYAPALLRVIIIGAGIGGLALAQLLHRVPNISITVYEKRARDSPDNLTGFRVMLSSFVARNLKASLPVPVAQAFHDSIGAQPLQGQEMKFVQGNGRELCKWRPDEVKDQFSVSRSLLRQALLEDLDGVVHFGTGFRKFTKCVDGRVMVYFENGVEDWCDLLVGADGFGSRVRRQFVPGSMVINTGVVVIYFKIPLTLETLSLMGSTSGTMAFCSHNQNIILHSWQNPNKIFATNYTKDDIEPTESFIMFGYGSPVSRFVNRRCAPQNLTKQELKNEVVARSRAEKKMHHTFLALVEKCLVETAFVHVVKKCEAIRPWSDDQVTLIGDAVFKYVVMATTLGKGANCALLGAISLTENLTLPRLYTSPSPFYSLYSQALSTLDTRQSFSAQLVKFSKESVARRLEERSRSEFLQTVFYFGEGKLATFCRDTGIELALKWIERER
ncbi:hypothetical protein BKA61DRAFT_551754 [Leptodontidium sp. MPI-SDFR-AT-0119]|nr:hypothetical protein BKA61DRAFT_551754 [Leptodontidium sp. MPI-SDFR-AT-0119]